MMFDLVIALSIFLIWMVGDARERGIGYGKYLLLTATFGSAGPLAYLLHRELRAGDIAEPTPVVQPSRI